METNQRNHMSVELERIKQDLMTMERAIGNEPEFNRRHVWASVGWGASGLALMLMGIFPRALPTPWGTVVFLVLFLAPWALMRKSDSPVSAKDLNSGALNGILTVLLLEILYWFSRMATPVPYGLVMGILCVLGGAWSLLLAWGRPWRLGLHAWTLAFMALGFAFPFLPKGTDGLALGMAV